MPAPAMFHATQPHILGVVKPSAGLTPNSSRSASDHVVGYGDVSRRESRRAAIVAPRRPGIVEHVDSLVHSPPSVFPVRVTFSSRGQDACVNCRSAGVVVLDDVPLDDEATAIELTQLDGDGIGRHRVVGDRDPEERGDVPQAQIARSDNNSCSGVERPGTIEWPRGSRRGRAPLPPRTRSR